jgi:hypothetical protein
VAYDEPSLQMAWTQIQILRMVYGMNEAQFVIYHANELHPDMPTVRALEALPHVRVESLEGWYGETYPHLVRNVSLTGNPVL